MICSLFCYMELRVARAGITDFMTNSLKEVQRRKHKMAKDFNGVVVWMIAGLVTGLLAIASFGFPQLRFIVSLAWAAPIAFIVCKYGLSQGVGSILVAGVLVGLLSGPVAGGIIMLEIGPLAIAIGLLYKNKVPAGRAMIICVLVATIIQLVELWVTYGQLSTQWVQIQKEFGLNVDQLIAAYKKSGALEQASTGLSDAEIRTTMQQSLQMFFQLLPGISVIAATITALTNYRFAHRYFTKGGITLPKVLPYRQWRLPWYIIWATILGLAGVIFGPPESILLLSGRNLLVVSGFLGVLIGISIVAYYLSRSKIPGLIKGLLIVFLVLNGIFSLAFIMMIGVFDPIINFRRLGVKTE